MREEEETEGGWSRSDRRTCRSRAVRSRAQLKLCCCTHRACSLGDRRPRALRQCPIRRRDAEWSVEAGWPKATWRLISSHEPSPGVIQRISSSSERLFA